MTERVERCAVLQSNYLPWRGYFDLIHDVDLFVFYDEVQYTKNDWRNRNRIVTPKGSCWITVPVYGSIEKTIDEIEIVPDRWAQKHYQMLVTNYSKAPHFHRYQPWLKEIYWTKWAKLSDLNQTLIQTIAYEFLGITTMISHSHNYHSAGTKGEKLLSLLKSIGVHEYHSGPAAQSYLDVNSFAAEGISVVWKDYRGYPEYRQLKEPFDPYVSILDLLFNVGPDAPEYIWGWRDRR